jgi:glycosyltransferase involved in cell wall biosynthesis
MRLLFIVDGRSPIALNWIQYYTEAGHTVHLASLYACQPELALASLTVIPVAFTQAAQIGARGGQGNLLRKLVPPGLRTRLRQRFVPGSLPRAARRLAELIERTQPDLVHAMRIPYEGMVAAQAVPAGIPLLVSVWGNDFTLHAPSTPQMSRWTRLALERATALHADCRRDVRLAAEWGFDSNKPSIVLPGAGGIQLEVFHPPQDTAAAGQGWLALNPRGLRAYVRNDTFFQALPVILAARPELRFACTGMAGVAEAEGWLRRLGIEAAVELLPHLSREQMAEAFRRSQIVLSITTHDGTPNTLLEAMACGCFPIAGDLESLREWITPGENGLLVDPGDPQALAQAILQAAADPGLRRRAREINLGQVAERAEYGRVMAQAADFYRQLIS